MPIFTFQMGTENINKWEKAFNNLEKGRKMIGRKNRRLKQESETNSEAVYSFDGGKCSEKLGAAAWLERIAIICNSIPL